MNSDFEKFVTALGVEAKRFTPEQLRRMHADMKLLVELLLEIRVRRGRTSTTRSPHPPLDGTNADRTME
jgi:hypothetical protein